MAKRSKEARMSEAALMEILHDRDDRETKNPDAKWLPRESRAIAELERRHKRQKKRDRVKRTVGGVALLGLGAAIVARLVRP